MQEKLSATMLNGETSSANIPYWTGGIKKVSK